MGNAFYHTKKSVEQYIKMAEGYDGKEIIDKLKNHVSENAQVLELGSGPGADLEILSNFFNVTGSDFSNVFVELLDKKFPNNEILNLNAIDFQTEKKFDCIYSNKVLHHLKNEDLIKSIQCQVQTLTNNGIICHTFWKGEGTEEMKGLLFNYHTENETLKLFTDDFELIILETYTELEKDDSLLLIAKKS